MPTDVTVRALKSFPYRGRSYRRDDAVTMAPIDAAIHARRGNVSLAKGYQTRVATSTPPSSKPEPTPDPPRRTRRYRRRDMVAEDQNA